MVERSPASVRGSIDLDGKIHARVLTELLLRFLVGGLVVSAFSVVGDVLKPKSFAGIFGAAPSVALATLGLTFATHPPDYVGAEARSMLAGAVAFVGYGLLTTRLIGGRRWSGLAAAIVGWLVWLAVAVALWLVLLR